jgi:hypothetical protein
MQALLEQINSDAVKIKKLLNNLIECSNIVRWNYSAIVVAAGDYQWEQLNDNGRIIQTQLINEYNRFINIIRFLIIDLPNDQQRIFETSIPKVLSVIEQNGYLFKIDKETQLETAIKAVGCQLNLLSALYEVTDDTYLIIPDMDALIANPEIEKWKFDGIEKFNLILLATVVDGLDGVTTKRNAVKNKGENNIKKIKEYIKSDNIKKRVMLNGQNTISYMEIQKLEKTLPWLDLNDNRDRIIAAYFEVVKANSHSQVVIVTNDGKLQEKLLFSKVSYIKPPAQNLNN